MFRSLLSFNFRVWFVGALVSNIGTWLQTTAINWYILTELTDGDATAVGTAFALQFAPGLLLLPLTGWMADRFDRKTLILVTQSLLLVQVAALGVFALTGHATLELLLLFSVIYGVINALDIPVRQTFVTDLVEGADLSNAIALNSTSYNLGRLVGPAIAGAVLIMWGAGWAFLTNALTFLVLIIALLLIRRREMIRRPARTQPMRIWGGFRYIRRRPDIVLVIITIFLVSAFAVNVPLTSATMVDMFGGDAAAFGFVNSVVALGSVVGALVAARLPRARLSTLVISVAVMAAAAFGAAIAPSIPWYCVPLALTGFASILALTTANGFIQSTSHPIVRGRVVAAYMAITLSATTVGSPILGLLSDTWGARWAVAFGGFISVLALAIAAVWLRIGVPAPPKFDEEMSTGKEASPPTAELLPPGVLLIGPGPGSAPSRGEQRVGDEAQ